MTRVCYIGGFGRSGSTLLERILAQATGACALGEVVWVWERGLLHDERCGCGERFSRCGFWQAIGDEAFGGWSQVDALALDQWRRSVDRIRNAPVLASRRARHRRAVGYSSYPAAIYAAARKLTGAPVVIDSSKHPSLAFALRLNPRIDLRVIHLVRDSRGVAYSWTKTMERPEASQASPTGLMTTYPPYRSAMLWNAGNLAFGLLGAVDGATRRLRYEDLLAEPFKTIAELGRFIGAEACPSRAFRDERTVDLQPAHQISGNPARLRTGLTPLEEDDAWHTSLDARHRRTVSALTLPLLAGYGYLRPTRSRT